MAKPAWRGCLRLTAGSKSQEAGEGAGGLGLGGEEALTRGSGAGAGWCVCLQRYVHSVARIPRREEMRVAISPTSQMFARAGAAWEATAQLSPLA